MRLLTSALCAILLASCTFSSRYVYVDVRLPVASTPREAQHDTATPASVPTMYATQEHAPTVTQTPESRACVVQSRRLNVRTGPGVTFALADVEALWYGAEVRVIRGQTNENGDLWYQTADGWVAAWLVGC